ncbi:hypothetical protein GGR57DRAFT_487535 [Xylariaceae sp. FL1272]|nr:hypothetical protein GGR57DRAFT_487535 [Xylariaceae sp. FL1272]
MIHPFPHCPASSILHRFPASCPRGSFSTITQLPIASMGSASKSGVLPRDVMQWTDRVQALGLGNLSIHDADTHFSGSTIDERKFLLLRIIWLEKKSEHMLYKNPAPWISDEYFTKSRESLSKPMIATAWKNYLASISKSRETLTKEAFAGLGTFSLVRYHQLQTLEPDHSFTDEGRPKLDFTPVGHRTRLRLQTAAPVTPTRPSAHPTFADQFQELNISESPGSPDTEPSVSVSSSGLDTSSPFLDPDIQAKATEDEQIVNTALILFLNALTIHFPALAADWTLHRRAFRCFDQNNKKIYEARVDGVLRRKTNKEPLVILEVKPYLRDSKKNEIRMQESAQMAAWVNEMPPLSKQDKYHRLLISQDRHEVYLSFVEFDQSYVHYIKQRAPPSTTASGPQPSHLKMQEYGEFDTGNRTHMQSLGELVLAYALQACARTS